MEPAQAEIKVHHMYLVKTTVKKVEEVWVTVSGHLDEDKQTILTKEFVGWFVTFEGSREAMNFGPEKPSFTVGDKIRITFSHA